MERLTCVGEPVVYRTGIICPPAIARLNYSSRDEPGQTLHCFNRSPIIRQLLELQPTAMPVSHRGTIRTIGTYATCVWARINRLSIVLPYTRQAFRRELCLRAARTLYSYDCRRSIIASRQKEYALAAQ